MFLQKVRKQFRMVNPRGGPYPDIFANILSMSLSTYLHICILNVGSLNRMYGIGTPRRGNDEKNPAKMILPLSNPSQSFMMYLY